MAASSLPPKTDLPSSQNFEPPFEWVRRDDLDTLLLDVSGFRKEQLKVQVNCLGKNLKVSGERFIYGNQRISFLREFQLPRNCNISEIRAKFQNGHLYVIMPKSIPATSQPPMPTTATARSTDDGDMIKKSQSDHDGSKPSSMEADLKQDHLHGRKWEEGDNSGGSNGNQIRNVQGDARELRQMIVKNLVAMLVLLGLWIYLTYVMGSSSSVEKHELATTEICNI